MITNQSPEMLELMELLHSKFNLPRGAQHFTLRAGINDLPIIEVGYYPQASEVPKCPD